MCQSSFQRKLQELHGPPSLADIVQDIVPYFSAKSHVAPGPSYARDLLVVKREISGQRFQTSISGRGNEVEVVVVFCELRSQLRKGI